jgi:tripartite-type tricarboxylate transporter receptor subunit TctC
MVKWFGHATSRHGSVWGRSLGPRYLRRRPTTIWQKEYGMGAIASLAGHKGRAVLAIALAGSLAACGSDGGGDSASGKGGGDQAFAGERIDFVVPYEPGGGYDAYARGLAPYFEKCLDATIVVQNEAGAGGLVATNKTAAASADENRFQIVNTVGLVSAQIAGEQGANFDLNDLNWIGRVAAPANVMVVGADSDIESFDDILNAGEPVRFVAQGPGANDYLAPNILGAAYGFPFEVVAGFAGSPEARAAVIAGDADAHILPSDSQLGAIEAGDTRPIVTIDEEADPLLPDVPTIYDAAPPEGDAKEIIDNLVALGQTGRALIASPQMKEDRVQALREAWNCVAENEEAQTTLEKQQRPIQSLNGKETADLVAEVLKSPDAFQTLVRESSS